MNEDKELKDTAKIAAKEVIEVARVAAEKIVDKAESVSKQNEVSYNSLHEKLDILNVSSAVIEEKINGTNRRLDILNGKVAEHEKAIAEQSKVVQNFPLVQKLVFGAATLVLIGFFSALVALIITKQ